MKRHAFLTLILLFAAVLASCARGSSGFVDGMINPGDKIGDFLITTGGDEGVTYVPTLHCPFDESAGIESCEFPVDAKANVGIGFTADLPAGGTWTRSGQNTPRRWLSRAVQLTSRPLG
jgi:hypothetical protein